MRDGGWGMRDGDGSHTVGYVGLVRGRSSKSTLLVLHVHVTYACHNVCLVCFALRVSASSFHACTRYQSETGSVVVLSMIYVAFVFGVFAGCLSASRAVSCAMNHLMHHISQCSFFPLSLPIHTQ